MIACLTALLLAASSPAVPAGVRIPVALVGAISAASAKPGDTFRFRTTAAVQAGNMTIPAGTPGTGVVAAAHPGQHGLKPSTLHLEPRSLQLADGATIPVVAAAEDARTLNQTQRTHGIPFPLFIGGGFGFGGVGLKARTVDLADGTRFTVVTRS